MMVYRNFNRLSRLIRFIIYNILNDRWDVLNVFQKIFIDFPGHIYYGITFGEFHPCPFNPP